MPEQTDVLDADERRELEELRRQNAALRQEQSVFRYILAHLPHRIWWKDRDGRFLGANENFLRDMGMASLPDLLGKTDYDLGFPPEQTEFYVTIDRWVMETGQALLDLEEPQQRGDGLHTLSTSKVPMRDGEGRVTGTLGLFVDITERKQMEKALQRAKDEAEAAGRAKSEFLTTISHELRTPLTLILGPLEALLAESAAWPAASRSMLERMHRNAARLFTLVSDVLNFAKTEAGQMPVFWEASDASQIVSQLVEDARPAAIHHGIELSFELEGHVGVLPLDRSKYEKIVLNLVGNALKFTPAGGRVDVRLRADHDWLELSVSDTGPGIPHEKQGLLFQRFQQLDGSSTRRHEGSGIGLALVKQFAELMGGQVGVESEPGRGSRFFVRTLLDADRLAQLPPIESAARTELAQRAGSQSPSSSEGPVIPPVATEHPLRVLIAEDNEDLGAYLRDILMPEYRVEVTANGRVALDAARRQPPDILITDVMMPEMDGIDLLSAMKTDDRLRSVPVILLTAKASRDEIVKGLNAGADDYLSKPFGPAELTARVRSMARLHESTRALEQERRALHATLDELRQAQEQLVHAGKMAAVGTLVAGLAHELNNPLGVILMNAQSLARTAASESREAKALAAVERNARRCSHMVRSLLDVSRRKPRTLQSTTIEEVVSRVLELAQAEAWRRGIQLHSTPSGPAVPRIHGSPEDLEAALFNLVGNALDATPGEGSVCLSVKPQFWDDQPGIEVSVQDTGSGISPEILPRIFDPFFTSKPAGQGTGLGLSLTRKIVESHGGRIQVDSQLGSGTVFRIWLPAEGAPRVEAAPASLPAM